MNYLNFDPYLKGLEKVAKLLLIDGIHMAAFSIQ